MKFRQITAFGPSAIAAYLFEATVDDFEKAFGVKMPLLNIAKYVSVGESNIDFDDYLLVATKVDSRGACTVEGQFHGGLGVQKALRAYFLNLGWKEEVSSLDEMTCLSSPLAFRLLYNESVLLTSSWKKRLLSPPRLLLVGPANAGKSTLFNSWLKKSRVVVSNLPGTTRDFVEAEAWLDTSIDSMAIKLVDTAGVWSDADDKVDIAAVEMTEQELVRADFVIFVLDAQVELDQKLLTLINEYPCSKKIISINKLDSGDNVHLGKEYARDAVCLSQESEGSKISQIQEAILQKWGPFNLN